VSGSVAVQCFLPVLAEEEALNCHAEFVKIVLIPDKCMSSFVSWWNRPGGEQKT